MSNKDWGALAQLTTPSLHIVELKNTLQTCKCIYPAKQRVFAILTRPLANISHCFFGRWDIFQRKYLQNLKGKRTVAEKNEKNWKMYCIECCKSCEVSPHCPPLVGVQGKGRKTSPLESCFCCWGPTSHSIPRRREIQVNKVLQRCTFIFEQNVNWVSSLVSLWPTVTQNMMKPNNLLLCCRWEMLILPCKPNPASPLANLVFMV